MDEEEKEEEEKKKKKEEKEEEEEKKKKKKNEEEEEEEKETVVVVEVLPYLRRRRHLACANRPHRLVRDDHVGCGDGRNLGRQRRHLRDDHLHRLHKHMQVVVVRWVGEGFEQPRASTSMRLQCVARGLALNG
jgi:hypothetical protein